MRSKPLPSLVKILWPQFTELGVQYQAPRLRTWIPREAPSTPPGPIALTLASLARDTFRGLNTQEKKYNFLGWISAISVEHGQRTDMSGSNHCC